MEPQKEGSPNGGKSEAVAAIGKKGVAEVAHRSGTNNRSAAALAEKYFLPAICTPRAAPFALGNL